MTAQTAGGHRRKNVCMSLDVGNRLGHRQMLEYTSPILRLLSLYMQSVHMQTERVSVFICSVHIGLPHPVCKITHARTLPPPWRFENRHKLYIWNLGSVLCIALLFGWHCLLYSVFRGVFRLFNVFRGVFLGSLMSLEVSLGSSSHALVR